MATVTAGLDFAHLDAEIERAVVAGSASGLPVLGFGEVTLVLGWPPEAPEVAVKRLPPVADRGRADAYGEVLDAWIAALERAGVRVLDTELHWVPSADGHLCGYLVQPLIERDRLLNHVLRRAGGPEGAALLERLAEAVCAAVDERIGLDAQAANWVVEDGELRCLDVSTPMLRDDAGHDRLDLELFLAAYPWALRRALAPVAHHVIAQYHHPRGVLLDTASNLFKERLEHWIPVLLAAARPHLENPIDAGEVRRYFTRDRRLWLTMQYLRRADRAWQRLVRRRPYPFLMPPPYRYGPPPEGGIP